MPRHGLRENEDNRDVEWEPEPLHAPLPYDPTVMIPMSGPRSRKDDDDDGRPPPGVIVIDLC